MGLTARPARRARAALLVASVLCGTASSARAQTRIAVLPIEGPQGDKAWQEARKAARRVGEVVGQPEWDASAARLFATSRSAEDLAAVAGDLKVQIVVTGKVKTSEDSGGWELSVSVRPGSTGKPAARLKYPLKGGKLDAVTLKHLADELPGAIETTAASAPEAGAAAGPPGTGAPTGEDAENPVAEALRDRAPPTGPAPLPPWTSWFEAMVGGLVGSRSLAFDQSGTPGFSSAGTGGLQLEGTVMPLAVLVRSLPALSGLGLGGSWSALFFPGSLPCYPAVGGGCLPTADRFDTADYRWEAGLRWRWNVQQRWGSPEVRAALQYGQHVFAIQRRAWLDEQERDVGPPDVAYSFVSVGAGGLFPVYAEPDGARRRLSLFVDLAVQVPLSAGPIQTPGEWGTGSAIGMRADAGLDLRIHHGLFARLGAQLELFSLSFDQPPSTNNLQPPCPCGTAGGARDLFYSGVLSVGYAH